MKCEIIYEIYVQKNTFKVPYANFCKAFLVSFHLPNVSESNVNHNQNMWKTLNGWPVILNVD